MAFLEQDLEEIIITTLKSVVTDIPVIGRSTPLDDGKPMTYVEVKADTRKRRGNLNPITDIQVSVICAVSKTYFTDAHYYLTQTMDKVVTQLETWGDDLDTACTALTVDTFRVDGFQFEGGSDIGYDSGNETWFCEYNLKISGVKTIPVEVED